MKQILNRWFAMTATQVHYNFADVMKFENIQINRKWLDERLRPFGLMTTSDSDKEADECGCIADLVEIEIDWISIFKYWTEIKQQTNNVSSDSEDYERDSCFNDRTESDSQSSCIRIIGLQLNLMLGSAEKNASVNINNELKIEEIDEIFDESWIDDDDNTETSTRTSSDVGFETVSNFIKHILAHLRLEIVDLQIHIPDVLSFDMFGTLKVGPEDTYGYRMIIIPKICIKSGIFEVAIGKDTQIKLHSDSDIQGSILKTKISAVTININYGFDCMNDNNEQLDGHGLLKILEVLTCDDKGHKNRNMTTCAVNLKIDSITVNLGEFSAFIYDFVLERRRGEDAINFITGHLLLKRKERILLESNQQMPIIIGSFVEDEIDVKIIERLLIEFESIRDIEEIIDHVSEINRTNTTTTSGRLNFKYKILLVDCQINLQLNWNETAGAGTGGKEIIYINLSDVLIENSDSEVVEFKIISISSKEIQIRNRTNEIRLQNIELLIQRSGVVLDQIEAVDFSEVKRFIENDEFVTIEGKENIYTDERLKFIKNVIKVENIFIEINDLYAYDYYKQFEGASHSEISIHSRNSKDQRKADVYGTISKNLNIKINFGFGDNENIDENGSGVFSGVEYEFEMSEMKFIKIKDFIDLRGKLNVISRNCTSKDNIDIRGKCFTKIVDSVSAADGCGMIAVSVTNMKTFVIDLMNFNVNVPYDILNLIKSDISVFEERFKIGTTNRSDFNSAKVDFYLRMKNVEVKLIPPQAENYEFSNNQARDEYLLITELNLKTQQKTLNIDPMIICYLDQMKLFIDQDAATVMNCGLMKIEIKLPQCPCKFPVDVDAGAVVKIKNYWIVFDFYGKESYASFLEIVRFWTEIYSPRIAKSDPQVILHESQIIFEDLESIGIVEERNENIVTEREGEAGKDSMVLLKGEWDESMEDLILEHGTIDSEVYSSDNYCDDSNLDLNHKYIKHAQAQTQEQERFPLDSLEDVLSGIDEDFFTYPTQTKVRESSENSIITSTSTENTEMPKYNHRNRNRNVLLEVNFGLQVNFHISNSTSRSTETNELNCITMKLKDILIKLYGNAKAKEMGKEEEHEEDNFLFDLEIEVNEGEILDLLEKSDWTTTLMSRWDGCGPDRKDRNFGQEKFLKICIKQKIINDKHHQNRGTDDNEEEYDLSISICPLRLFLNQTTVSELMDFFAVTSQEGNGMEKEEEELKKKFLYFNKVTIAPLAIKMDYKQDSSLSKNVQGRIPINLNGAEFILPPVQVSGVKGFEGLLPAISATWIPQLKDKKCLTKILSTGVVPVRTVLQVGEGFTNLILLPFQQNKYKDKDNDRRFWSHLNSQSHTHSQSHSNSNSNTSYSMARRAGKLRESCKKISLNSLNAATSIVNRTTQISIFNTQKHREEHPVDLESGLKQAAKLIIALPLKDGAELRAVPIIILDTIALTSGVILKTLQGLQAELDENYRTDTELKRRSKRK